MSRKNHELCLKVFDMRYRLCVSSKSSISRIPFFFAECLCQHPAAKRKKPAKRIKERMFCRKNVRNLFWIIKKNYFHFNFIIMCRNVFFSSSFISFRAFHKIFFLIFLLLCVCYHSSLFSSFISHHIITSFLFLHSELCQRGHRRQDERSTLGNINSLLVLNLFAHGKLW